MMTDNPHRSPVRESLFVLAGRIILLQFAIGLGSFIINTVVLWMMDLEARNATLLLIVLGIVSVVAQTLNAVLLMMILIRWFSTTYIIAPDKVTIRTGIARIHETVYDLRDVSSAQTHQSFLGRLFNYGTASLYIPSLKEEVHLKNIPRPIICSELLGQVKKSEEG